MAAATGSVRYAMAAANADYNGHNVIVYFNDYRKYHLCEYQWGERVVLSRGSLHAALSAGASEHRRGDRGCDVRTLALNEVDAALAVSLGYVPWSEDIEKAHRATWRDTRFDLVNDAMSYEKNFGSPAISWLVNSATAEEYEAKKNEWFAARRGSRKST